jgi:hypothetical protein
MRRIATGMALLCAVASAEAAEPISAAKSEAVALLDEVAAERAAGARRIGAPFEGTLGPRGTASLEVPLTEARCYEFLGVGGEGVQDLTLTIEVDGREVAADRISGVRPAARWCAPKSVRAVVRVAMYGGAGAFAVGVYEQKGAASLEIGGAESDFVANRLRQLYAQFGMGRAAAAPAVRGNLQEGAEQAFEFSVSAGRCYTVIGVADPTVKDLDVVVYDKAGAEVQRDATHGGFAVVSSSPCPSSTGAYTVKVRATAGSGQFGAQLFTD